MEEETMMVLVGPSVYLRENTNTLNVELSTYSNDGGADKIKKMSLYQIFLYKNGLTLWLQVITETVDVCGDGKACKTHLLDNVLRMDK